MIEDANAARQVINLPPQRGMTTLTSDHSEAMGRLYAAMYATTSAVLTFKRQITFQSRRLEWGLRILFEDDPKQRRRLIRDRAREYRRPALIHKGGKP